MSYCSTYYYYAGIVMNKENAQDCNTKTNEQPDTLALHQLDPTNLPGSLRKPILREQGRKSMPSSICTTPTPTLVKHVMVIVLAILA
jgi:hypothetical protein